MAAESVSGKMGGYKKATMLAKLSTSLPLITKLTTGGVVSGNTHKTQNTQQSSPMVLDASACSRHNMHCEGQDKTRQKKRPGIQHQVTLRKMASLRGDKHDGGKRVVGGVRGQIWRDVAHSRVFSDVHQTQSMQLRL